MDKEGIPFGLLGDYLDQLRRRVSVDERCDQIMGVFVTEGPKLCALA